MMDPRFSPVRPKDLTRLIVEVTVLFHLRKWPSKVLWNSVTRSR